MTAAADVLARARADNGYTEQPPGSNKTKFNDWYFGPGAAQPWCATALSKWFHDAGLPLPASTSKGFAYTPAGADWFRRNGKWIGRDDRRVTPGLVVFFYWPSLGRIGHVGIVDQVNPDGTFYSWEGNTDAAGGRTGGRVIRQHRSRATVGTGGGFGIPAYSTSPAPPQPTAIVINAGPTYEDATMQPHFVSLHSGGAKLDPSGRGYWDLPQFPFDRTVTVNPNVANPPEGGYNVPDVGFLRWGAGIRVVAEEAVAGGGLDVVVWLAGP